MIEITLPYPPSANNLWTIARRGRKAWIRRTDEYEAWLEEAFYVAKAQRPEGVVGPYKMTILAKRPDKRRRDVDNIIKPIGDLIQKVGIVSDDCHCELALARWVTTGDAVTVRIERAGVE